MTTKNLTTVITDHQLTADTIATALGANEKHNDYYLGNGYAVTWTNGSVIEATFSPNEAFVLASGMDPKLVYAHNFKFAIRDFDELLGYKKSEQDAKHLATVKALWKMSHTIVNAMMPCIESDLDFLSLYYFIGCPVKVRRAWLPILTKPAIVSAVTNGPKRLEKYEQWLSDGIYNKLVKLCKEDAELRGASVIEEMPVKEAAKETASFGVATPTAGETIEMEKHTIQFTDGLTLFNLPQLLIAGATELDFTHEQTIAAAFKLYAKKLISYPLAQQNTIPYEVWSLMKHNKEVLRHNSKWGKKVKTFLSRRHNFRSGENEFNGFGIVTTGLHPTDLTREEEKLYNLIVKRVLDAFTPVKNRYGKKTSKRKNSKKSDKNA